MSSESVDKKTLRQSIRRYINGRQTAYRDDLVRTVANRQNVPADSVRSQVDALEKHGFVYMVDRDSDGTEVKIP